MARTKKRRKRRSAKKRDVVSKFRNKLWDLFGKLAHGMDGAKVVEVLRQAGEEIWAAGIDGSYTDMSTKDQEKERVGNAFDISWLTVVCIKLKEIREGKKPTTRLSVKKR